MAIQAQFYSDNIGFSVGGSQDRIDNACRGGGGAFNQICFSLQQQQLQLLQNQQPWNQRLYFDYNRQSIVFEKQRHEIDQFIISQNEILRLLLQEQRKQQIAVLLKKIESKASILLDQKDEEIQKAINKTMELQNLLKKLEMDNHAWKRMAHENEGIVMSLNNNLEILREQASRCFNNGVNDAESWCEVRREGMEEQDEKRTRKTTMVCKCCYSRSSCVLFLPCRHLCSCKDCEAFLDSCPVCRTAKKASIEALIS